MMKKDDESKTCPLIADAFGNLRRDSNKIGLFIWQVSAKCLHDSENYKLKTWTKKNVYK